MLFLLFVVVFLSVGYSAFEINLFVDDSSVVVRTKSDIRITDVSVESVSDGVLVNYSEYNVGNISSSVYLPNNDSYVTYKVSVTNFGNVDMVLFDIVGLDSDLMYYFTDDNYVLGDKICDKNNVCNLGVTRDIYITIKFSGDNNDKEYNLDLEFEFVPYDKIVTTFDYVGETQEFVVPYDGVYKIELWGASGGLDETITIRAETSTIGVFTDRLVNFVGGYGGYVSGDIELEKDSELYVYVGEMGKRNKNLSFNGGGAGAIGGAGYKGSYLSGDEDLSGLSGGGATDIRLVFGEWSSFESLKSRIIVSGGGGGKTVDVYSSGGEYGNGGGLIGYSGGYYSGHPYVGQNGKGGSQTIGGSAATVHFNSTGVTYSGNFGFGGGTTSISSQTGGGGGGSGYYGGSGASGTLSGGSGQGGGGGSSFISGHDGCDAIDKNSTEDNIIHTGQSIHYSGYKFNNTIMIDGSGYKWTTVKKDYVGMPTHDGNGTMVGNVGNGYAKITLLELKD